MDVRGSWPFGTVGLHWISGKVQQDVYMTGCSPRDEDQAMEAESGLGQGEGRLAFTVVCVPVQTTEQRS